MTNPRKATKDKAICTRTSRLLVPVGLQVSHNTLVNTKSIEPTSPNKQSVLVPGRLGNNRSIITFDYKINRPYWPTPPNKLTLLKFCATWAGEHRFPHYIKP